MIGRAAPSACTLSREPIPPSFMAAPGWTPIPAKSCIWKPALCTVSQRSSCITSISLSVTLPSGSNPEMSASGCPTSPTSTMTTASWTMSSTTPSPTTSSSPSTPTKKSPAPNCRARPIASRKLMGGFIRISWIPLLGAAIVGAVFAVPGARTSARWQQKNDAADSLQNPRVLKVEVRVVLLDVVVTNKRGEPVSGLKKEQFQIIEDGAPQTLASFEEHHDAPQNAKASVTGSESGAPLPPGVYTSAQTVKPSDSLNVLLLDWLNTQP